MKPDHEASQVAICAADVRDLPAKNPGHAACVVRLGAGRLAQGTFEVVG
jgi:hypothetical protein